MDVTFKIGEIHAESRNCNTQAEGGGRHDQATVLESTRIKESLR
jgi:hypothetical protein